ncbi:Mg-protoporphyrin IX methyl transferase [Aquisphaera giovannonii]|uniref:Mg-protoporphyrin IX methyl transferase n=1 Tax=Aquisphaera giovannonii TaxID=406548 RepID=A0A5B9W6A2_9BACT|nr:class I SAM-dependent methyltransferase [Aquisphaera giovannonii]QEH35655.1 Mg-protoporphyrin IX methyl transferase [Aquisphaera giovannonii]
MGRVEEVIPSQERHWSRHAARYDEVFIDPFAPGVVNPLWDALGAVEDRGAKTVIDLGCGTGPLLPMLLDRYGFGRVIALDFAPAMLARARERLGPDGAARVEFLERPMADLGDLRGRVDVAVALNSLVMPDVRVIDATLRAVREALRPGGVLLGVVPSLDSIQYQTMLQFDQALEIGMGPAEARRFTATHAEHRLYDFAFGLFRYRGLRQKFWTPFEVEHRLARAGFRAGPPSKVLYPWDEGVPAMAELSHFPPSWDWFFEARP